MRKFYVYILTNKRNNVLYTGVTGNLEGRVKQHKSMVIAGFTKRYHVIKLVYYEEFDSPYDAIMREKQIKGWLRVKKEALVQSINPRWDDLSKEWF